MRQLQELGIYTLPCALQRHFISWSFNLVTLIRKNNVTKALQKQRLALKWQAHSIYAYLSISKMECLWNVDCEIQRKYIHERRD